MVPALEAVSRGAVSRELHSLSNRAQLGEAGDHALFVFVLRQVPPAKVTERQRLVFPLEEAHAQGTPASVDHFHQLDALQAHELASPFAQIVRERREHRHAFLVVFGAGAHQRQPLIVREHGRDPRLLGAEHGQLVLTPGTGLPLDEVVRKFPTDGMVTGVGTINGHLFEAPASRAAVLSYDYTVLAGTQGMQNHRKKDRLFELVERLHLPVVFFTEGGGGRPGDTDGVGVAGLDTMAFHLFARLSGLAPLVGRRLQVYALPIKVAEGDGAPARICVEVLDG